MAERIFTGDKELDAKLLKLQTSVANKLAKYVLRKGVSVVAKAEKSLAPVGQTKALKKSIGSRVAKRRDGVFEAKAGINVGKMTKSKYQGRLAPHAHLVALGTVERFRTTIGGRFAYIKNPSRAQLRTGAMPSNAFIKQAYSQSRAAATTAMRAGFYTQLRKELAKLK